MSAKKALVIQDISAIGRVSMMVALPILIGAGIRTSCIPTALLSTHSGEFKDFSFLDLSGEMEKIIAHWERLALRFDAVQTGYLGSHRQIEEVRRAIALSGENARIIVDPVMADHGRLYSGISQEMVASMRSLCEKASVLLPNLTEASFLLGVEYQDRFDDRRYIEEMLYRLGEKLGVKQIVLTGVSSRAGKYGAACYDRAEGSIEYFERNKIDDHFFGTGDIFASVFTAALLNEKSLYESTELAVAFTHRAIEKSKEQNLPRRFGVSFEQHIPWLLKQLGLM